MFYQISNKLNHIEIPRDYDAFFARTSSAAGSDSVPASDRSQTSTNNYESAAEQPSTNGSASGAAQTSTNDYESAAEQTSTNRSASGAAQTSSNNYESAAEQPSTNGSTSGAAQTSPNDYESAAEQPSTNRSASGATQTSTNNPTTAVTLTAAEWKEAKESLGFPPYTGSEHTQINSCRIETHAKYIFGSLCVPDRRDPKKPPLKLIFYINSQFIVFVDNSQTADRVIGRMIPRYEGQEMNPAFFLFGFLQEFLNNDMELLEKYEHHLFLLEERALRGNIENLLTNILRARRELTRLRNYYGQMQDLTRGLLANTKHFFPDEELQILTLISDRASQLEGITQQSIDYCQTLRDFEQAQSDHKQNKTIRFLTISTSIFFPLTVITGWYGMNFTYMPEINTRYGYFIVIAVSAAVITVELIILKIKKML